MAIHKTYIINAPVKKVWQALTDPKMIEEWGAGSDVVMDDKEGTEFSLWDGDITGTNTEVIPEKKLVQNWFGGEWDEPSILTIILTNLNGKTEIKLTHSNLPKGQEQSFSEGWDEYYFGPMKELLEGKLD